mmetsp:Transcript_96849/g.177117  ORF Transcript_96849/g.177117 Transcript_96849/m.177117 type:complete len:102 (-) Transcript_96849:65-370(-)
MWEKAAAQVSVLRKAASSGAALSLRWLRARASAKSLARSAESLSTAGRKVTKPGAISGTHPNNASNQIVTARSLRIPQMVFITTWWTSESVFDEIHVVMFC